MGLADRFKTELNNQNIFSEDVKINTPNKIEITKMITTPKELSEDKFSIVRKDILNKIQKTPYWSDYSVNSQENMIVKYFEAKNRRSHIEYNTQDKIDFVKTILDKIAH